MRMANRLAMNDSYVRPIPKPQEYADGMGATGVMTMNNMRVAQLVVSMVAFVAWVLQVLG